VAVNREPPRREAVSAGGSAEILQAELDLMVDLVLDRRRGVEFREAVQDWYRQRYECAAIPKPDDTDRVRLALKASIVERLVEVLNSPPRDEHQVVPLWCSDVGALAEPLKLLEDRFLNGEEYCPPFEKRNIFALKNFMYFV
jgi:hypothetical protein